MLLSADRAPKHLTRKKPIMTACPECEGQIEVPSDAIVGEIVPCGGCGAELEVAGTNPLNLSLAPEVAEDWGE